MKYISTRDVEKKTAVTSAQAIKQGIAGDGGLFLPESFPSIDGEFIASLIPMSYTDRAVAVLSLFLDDYTHEELRECASAAYSAASFPGGAAPVVKLKDSLYTLELWHGPTCAFKDMALQIMPRLLSLALDKTGEMRNALVLVATSGDTGKAALEGYRDVDRIKIKVFYPAEGVSNVQKLQMITQNGSNVGVYGIKGNFDDAQTAVKRIFADERMQEKVADKGYFFSSANSINWGRLVPQVVYYFSAYCDLVKAGRIRIGEKVNFCVPTGNFGDIFAAYVALRMGLPVNRLICASNSNNVLTDFLRTGEYNRNREFRTTISPSMDILVSSNLERLLCCVCGPEKTAGYMKLLSETGSYRIASDELGEIMRIFTGGFADEDQTSSAIRRTYDTYGYLSDTHTAVGLHCAEEYLNANGGSIPVIVVSTASPFKFAGSVYKALTFCKPLDSFEDLSRLSELTGTPVPMPLAGLNERRIKFDQVIRPADMPRAVAEEL